MRAGLAAVRARVPGWTGPPLDPHDPRAQMAKALYKNRIHEVREICHTLLHISRSTLYRYLTLPYG